MKRRKIIKRIYFRVNRSGRSLIVNGLHGLIRSDRVLDKITQQVRVKVPGQDNFSKECNQTHVTSQSLAAKDISGAYKPMDEV